MMKQPGKLSGLLGLTRPGVLLALVSVQWVMVFLGVYVEPVERRNPVLGTLGVSWALVASAVVAAGMGIFLLALNDALDARHDRAFEPDKPIPSGRVTQRAALGLAMVGLLAALGAAVALGPMSVILALVATGAIVFYNLAGRFIPAVGIITLGLIIGVAALIPNPRLAFAWPILLMMTHVIAAATVRHVLAGKRPRLKPIDGWGISIGWVFWVLVVLVLIGMRGRDVSHEGVGQVWIGPALAAAVFAFITWLLLGPSALKPRARRGTAKRFAHFTTAWLIVFNASWLISAGLWWQGGVVIALLIAMRLPGAAAAGS
jgi:hypothetical protein